MSQPCPLLARDGKGGVLPPSIQVPRSALQITECLLGIGAEMAVGFSDKYAQDEQLLATNAGRDTGISPHM